MKILIKECKKIMDIRVLLVLAVFTVLFYQLFLEVTIYPAGGQTTDSQYDMPFYAELIEIRNCRVWSLRIQKGQNCFLNFRCSIGWMNTKIYRMETVSL